MPNKAHKLYQINNQHNYSKLSAKEQIPKHTTAHRKITRFFPKAHSELSYIRTTLSTQSIKRQEQRQINLPRRKPESAFRILHHQHRQQNLHPIWKPLQRSASFNAEDDFCFTELSIKSSAKNYWPFSPSWMQF